MGLKSRLMDDYDEYIDFLFVERFVISNVAVI